MSKSKKTRKLLKFFEETVRPDNWEIYMPFEDDDQILLLRPVCSKCKKFWSVDRKECFHCKTKYFRVKQCPKCGKLYPENVPKCSVDKIKNVKKCLNCGKIDDGRKVVFVPNTFCRFCGNRENKFEFKIIKL